MASRRKTAEPVTLRGVSRSELARAVLAERCRRSLAAFIRETWHITNPGVPYEHSWHIDVVADHVQRQLEEWAAARLDPTFAQLAQNLLINIPPRCLKSTIVSICAMAWAWLRWPDMKIGCLSSNPRVSKRDARAFRTLVSSDWFHATFAPAWEVSGDQDALENIGNTAGGTRAARGFNAVVVGEGFDWILVDDPHDPRDGAGSAAMRSVIDGWDSAVSSRQQDARVSIRTCIAQQVSEGDFSDHVRAHGWGRLCLPMEAEPLEARADYEPSAYGWRDTRAVGEVLHPARFPPRVLEQRKIELGPYGYAAQYQQRPAPMAGGMIKREWFKPFTLGEVTKDGKLDFDCVTITIDPAGNANGDGDNVGMLVVGNKGPRRYILEDATRKMTFLETCATVRELLSRYPTCRKILIEKSVVGPAIVEQLRREVNQGALRVVVVEELTTHMLGKKEQRAMAMVPTLAAGLVFVLEGASWVPALVGEHGLFPNGQHDDRVDALAQLIAYYGESDGVARARKLANLGSVLMRMQR